jgi:hypothetical protein
MQRFMGFLLLAVGVTGVLTQWLVGINQTLDHASRYILGPSYGGAYGSPVGEAIVYLVFYFVAVAGLALLATSKRKRRG